MKTLYTDKEHEEMLDTPTRNSFIDLLKKDVIAYTSKYHPTPNEWVARSILINASTHEGSKIPFGCSLIYLFKELPFGFDMGIKEITIAESLDDFLDLYNDITKDEDMLNIDMKGFDSRPED